MKGSGSPELQSVTGSGGPDTVNIDVHISMAWSSFGEEMHLLLDWSILAIFTSLTVNKYIIYLME